MAFVVIRKIRWDAYDNILLISKSVGTAITAAYARMCNIVYRNVFYTPVVLTFDEHPRNGIVFTGTADP